MERRLLLIALTCWPASRLLAQDENERPRQKVSAKQLHEALSARFPVRIGIPGVLELRVTAPALLLLPTRDKLGATLQAQLSGAHPQQRQDGEVDVAFALRYEAADQTVRGHRLEILALRWPGQPPETIHALQRMLATMARDAVGEVVLHKFSPRELALADTMGFEPEKVTVVDDGLLVWFRPKPLR